MGNRSKKVFISWSGEKSLEIAHTIKFILENNNIDCFISTDIPMGSNWSDCIHKELDNSGVMIFCVTKENLNSPFFLYELGLVSQYKKSIIPILIDLGFDDLEPSNPLSRYQVFSLYKDDFSRCIEYIWDILGVKYKEDIDIKYDEPEQKIIEEHYISSVEEYLTCIFDIDKKNKENNKETHSENSIFYRGQTKYQENHKNNMVFLDPMPSIFRSNYKLQEKEIYNQIITECAEEFENCHSHCEILTKMQHYQVPTRLLDITSNALVALFFACVGFDGTINREEAIVFVIQSDKKHTKIYDSDTVTILSSLSRFSFAEQEIIKKCANDAIEESKKEDTDPIKNLIKI
jgi:hypothetical protein